MRKILSRIDKLEKTNKSKFIEIENKMQREAQREQSFHSLNLVMKKHYPENAWSRLPSKERRRIYFTEPKGTYDYTNRLLPKFIPFNKKESDLEFEVHSLYAEVIKKEILRRRELTRGKIKNN